MYAPPGHGFPELGDVEVVPVGDELHLFHLTLPNHDLVQHAVSTDGLRWHALPPALRTGDPGECDDDQIWTMSVVPERDGYLMLYTALSRADGGRVQRVAAARSADLITWKKVSPEPVAEADPRWYESDPATTGSVSWRDPKPFHVGDGYMATVAARELGGPLLRRGCVGLLASDDLRTWEVRPPLFAPRRFWDMECPQLFTLGDPGEPDACYLTAAIMEDRRQRYWRAPSWDGPFETPADGGVLAPVGHYAGRVCRWQGLDLLWCWHQPRLPLGWLTTIETLDWLPARNPFGKHLVAPLVLRPRPDGSIGRHPFPGWLAYRAGPLRPLSPEPETLFGGLRLSPDDPWRIDATGGAMDVAVAGVTAGDCWLEATLAFACPAGGLAFRLDREGGGYFIELRSDGAEVTLQKWIPERDPRSGARYGRYQELQRGPLPRPIAAGRPFPIRLLLNGPVIECSVDGEVVLSELSGERLDGALGLWAESGTARAADVRWAPMRRVDGAIEDGAG